MSEISASRRILHLVMGGLPPAGLREITGSAGGAEDVTEIFELTEANAREALEKIFTADTVAVWGDVSGSGRQEPLNK